MTVLVTGANGFIGHSLTKTLLSGGYPVVAAVRRLDRSVAAGLVSCANSPILCRVEDINGLTSWHDALEGVQTVVHCAARAHVVREKAVHPLDAFREVNTVGTLRLAQQAVIAGVKRFVFLSSIGVNGNHSIKPFTEADPPNPHDPYSCSKLEAEEALLALSQETKMEVVIIRSPLVYGPNVLGNFRALVRWVQLGIPSPLGAVHNQRSLLALDNLVSFILLCSDCNLSPQAANQVFVLADGEDVSTTILMHKIAQAAGCPSRLLPVPCIFLRIAASILGKRIMAHRLLDNLQVDATKARTLLGWRPIVTLDQQLAAMFTSNSNKGNK
jgi:nucleoside-diphosphate-sugar epimerase